MSDAALALIWVVILAVGLGACVLLKREGVPTTYVRDLLHLGAGVWVLGFPHWEGAAAPLVIVGGALLLVALIPLVSSRNELARRVQSSVSGDDERWEGIVFYVTAFAVMTALALLRAPFPAAAALWALVLGDGIGGAVGRRFGRLRFRVPYAKPKSAEGAAAVFAFATLGVYLAALLFDAQVSVFAILGMGALAAVAEALSPRATDNLFIPAVVWAAAEVWSS